MDIEILKIIPEYIKVVFSWPVAVLSILLVFIFKFSKEISEILSDARISKLKLDFRNRSVEAEFYKLRLAQKMGLQTDQIRQETVPISNGNSVIIGISTAERIVVRFLADIRYSFDKLTTIDLIDEKEALNNSVSVAASATGIFQDTSNTSSLGQSSLSMLKVRVRIGNKEKIYGRIII